MLLVMMATMFSVDVFAGSAPSTPDYLICGDCGKGVTYEFNTCTKELKILGKGEMDDFKPIRKEFTAAKVAKNVTKVTCGAVNVGTKILSEPKFKIPDNIRVSSSVSSGILITTSILGFFGDHIIDVISDKAGNYGTVPWRDYMYEIQFVTVSDGVTKIGVNAFAGLENLKQVKIGNTVTHIGLFAFCRCINLTSIEIGNGIRKVDDDVFFGCEKLTKVKSLSTYDINCPNAFNTCTELQEIEVPCDYEGDTFCGIKVVKHKNRM
jgi:hypothetical protein